MKNVSEWFTLQQKAIKSFLSIKFSSGFEAFSAVMDWGVLDWAGLVAVVAPFVLKERHFSFFKSLTEQKVFGLS